MLAEQGVAPAAWDFAIPAPGRLGSPSALLRGLPSMAGRDWMKGGESRLDNVRDNPPVRPRKHGPEVRQTPQWSAGGCACRQHGTQHRKVPEATQRLSAL